MEARPTASRPAETAATIRRVRGRLMAAWPLVAEMEHAGPGPKDGPGTAWVLLGDQQRSGSDPARVADVGHRGPGCHRVRPALEGERPSGVDRGLTDELAGAVRSEDHRNGLGGMEGGRAGHGRPLTLACPV